ncbi:UNVERIFIED_CONTAM: CHD3-type chromatin-remodeling factor PICKLE [Sesamum angustifolium]|uniref:CHD3-type chromatin-remodeling factor PICKLE n=1 Tax=Sesamum angustifolium TaxID=2727405 RepID=A0AAW2JBR7_9LAMI
MASLVERLRVRSDRRPIYNLDESDEESDFTKKKSGTGPSSDKTEKIERPDVKEGLCQACEKDGNLWSCETCNYAYHPKCLLPPSRGSPPSSWKCPECVGHLNELEKILDCEMRPGPANDSDASKLGSNQVLMKHYLVKWKGLSYLHCTWVPEMEFGKAYKSNPRLRTKVNNFHKQASSSNNSEDENVPIRPDWTTVDRVIACREVEEGKEYLIKWKELPYDECYWELESSVASFHKEIEKFNRIQSRHDKVSVKQKSNLRDAMESKKKQKEFQQYESSPDFLSGGSLHPYQLEGLNFLRFAWSKQTHVILADEMGLGKTIQSIAFLASLFEENLSPHLVVAPLSTLRNWEREFATWAPHMNVIVDEGHRLKNKDSKLFSSLKQYCSRHRVLLTGTPLQNNLDELFMLMHFLDAGKLLSLEKFISLPSMNVHKKHLPTPKEIRTNLHLNRSVNLNHLDIFISLLAKSYLHLQSALAYRSVIRSLCVEGSMFPSIFSCYTSCDVCNHMEILTRKGGADSLINVVMELRKLCCHPFMLEGVEPEDANEFNKQLLETSGKLQLLDKMMVKLKEQGHRVLIYSQFQHMLDLLEEYCNYRKWHYERIDGKVGGAERQIRIDRFNAKNSSRFCFLLSTRAGGLGINLATADTVIIYDSDWNPHADLQAMARAHRLGQTNKVMIYRLIARGTIEERMMQMTKKKMVLEHLVVGRLKAQNINQEELDDIIRYGSKELFADDNDESVKSRQIHYDDTAIDRLLNRDQVGDEEAAVDDEEEDGFLKAFKVANFEYVDEAELAAEEETPVPPAENKASVNSSERASYWEDLLRDKYEVHKIEEFNAMGKGKRSRKQMVSVEEDDLAGLEDVSSDAEDDNYEAELTDNETASGAAAARRTYRKRARADTSEKLPLMEGEGRYFRVLGFNQNQRAVFVQILMRFGVGEYDWAEFAPRLKQKTYEEINDYGRLFLGHIVEEITDSPTFSDGVPKEGLRIEDVLVRIGTLSLIRDKVKALSEGSILFTDDIISRYPGLKGGRVWKEHHDRLLLRAVQKHGYGRWQAIVDDKDLRIQEVICQELNLPFINAPAPGAPQGQNSASGTSQPQFHPSGMSQTQASASGVSQPHAPTPGFSQSQNGVNSERVEAPGNQAKGTTGRNDFGADVAQGATDTPARAQLFQDQSMLYHFREMQRRQVEFIKKRVLLLEKGLIAELQKVHFADVKTSNVPNGETGHKVTDLKSPSSEASDAQMIDQLPQVELFSPEEILAFACDKSKDRLDMARLYNEVSRIIADNGQDLAEASYRPASLRLQKNLGALEAFNEEINHILSSVQLSSPSSDKLASKEAEIENVGSSSTILATDAMLGVENMDTDNPIQSNQAEPNKREIGNITAVESFSNGVADVEMEEEDNSEKSAPDVIIMD